VVNELKRIYGDVQIDLDQSMGPHFVEAILDTEANQLSQEFRTALYRQTQGHPLFTIELLWDMQQRGDIVHNDQDGWVEGSSLNWETLPARVEAVIKERLDRMEEDLRDILTVASVEGERFTAQVLARVQKIGERQLLRDLSQALEKRHRLVRSQGEVEVGHQFLSYFQFSHTLFQQYLYHSLSVGERRLLHGEIAAALEGLYQDQTDEITVQLARHYAEAGQGEKAVDYLLQAGDRARTLYAHQEAIDFYQQALIFLEEQRAYERAARTLMKLGLTYHLAFNFQQARQAYEEGFSLWQQVGASQPPPLSPAPHPLRLPAGEPPTLDPTIAGDTTSVSIIVQLFSGLVELSPEMEVVPEVARSWDVLEGGCKYIFHLRDDVRWSDGTPVTAQDFEYAWKRVLHPNTDSTNATLLYELKGARAFHQGELSNPNQVGVQALDEVTLAVELESPTSYFPHLLTYNATYPVPRHVVEAYGEAWTAVENIVTNGPFRLEAWQQEKSIILRRNPDYQGRFTGNVQEVELSLMEKSSAGLKLYEADRLDTCYLWSLSGPEMDRVRQRYADEYLSTPALGTQIIAFDTSRPPFDDRRVRQAFVMAVDRETLADVVMGGYAFPATGGFVPPGMPGHSPGIALPYDPEQARQLLAEAGYPEGRGFPAIQWSMGYQENEFFGKYLQAQWDANLKINLTWETTTKEAMFYGKSDEGRPHMFRMGWSADFPDPDNFLRASCVRDLSYWRNETYQQLLEEARQVTDQAKRVVLYQQADKILVEEAVIMPYFYARGHELVKPWVSRYPTSPIRTWFWKDIVIEPH
jgi:oligopeptide transport system substrate-binding protein